MGIPNRIYWETIALGLSSCLVNFGAHAQAIAPPSTGAVGVLQNQSNPKQKTELGVATRVCLNPAFYQIDPDVTPRSGEFDLLALNRADGKRDYWIAPAHLLGNTAVSPNSKINLVAPEATYSMSSARIEMYDSKRDLVLFSTVPRTHTRSCVPLARQLVVQSAYSVLALNATGEGDQYIFEGSRVDGSAQTYVQNHSSNLAATVAKGRPGRELTGPLLQTRQRGGFKVGQSGSALLGHVDALGNRTSDHTRKNPRLIGMLLALRGDIIRGEGDFLPAPTIFKRILEYFKTGRTDGTPTVQSLADGSGIRFLDSGATQFNMCLSGGQHQEGGSFGTPKEPKAPGIGFPGSDRLWFSFGSGTWSEYEPLSPEWISKLKSPEALSGVFETERDGKVYIKGEDASVAPWLRIPSSLKLFSEASTPSPDSPRCTVFKTRALVLQRPLTSTEAVRPLTNLVESCEKPLADGGRMLWLRVHSQVNSLTGTPFEARSDGLTLRVRLTPGALVSDGTRELSVDAQALKFSNPEQAIESTFKSSNTLSDLMASEKLSGAPLKRLGLRYFYNDDISFWLTRDHGLEIRVRNGNSDDPITGETLIRGPLVKYDANPANPVPELLAKTPLK